MNKCLILGRGYIGTELSSKLKNSICLNRSDLDYTDINLLKKYIIKNNINFLINCVGFTGRPNIDEAEKKKSECWFYNVKLPLMFSTLAKELNIKFIQISSGCIYTGYEKEWGEEDEPNFGMFHDSSFYSKTKHAFESLNNYGLNIRVRMPFGDELVDRNYIKKILNYDNLINFRNSKTYICDLSRFINYIISNNKDINIGNLNFVNPEPLETSQVLEIMKNFGLSNSKWKFVDISDIDIAAPRSNCILSMNKMNNIFPDFILDNEENALKIAISKYI